MTVNTACRAIRSAVALALLGAACAGPQPAGPPAPAPGAAPAGPPWLAVPSALVAADPRVARATAALQAAGAGDLAALLLARATAAAESAQALRWSRMRSWDLIPPEDEKRYVAFYELALRDCEAVLERFPQAPEAARAQLTVGILQDYPHLADFDKADQAYVRTIERHPGTAEAREATERLRKIRTMLGAPGVPPPPKP